MKPNKRGTRRIYPFAQADEISAALGKSLANGNGVCGGSGEPGKGIDDEHGFLLTGLSEGCLQCRSIIGSPTGKSGIHMDGGQFIAVRQTPRLYPGLLGI